MAKRDRVRPGLRLVGHGSEATVLYGSRRIDLPVVQLESATLAAVRPLVRRRPPHIVVAAYISRLAKEALERKGWGWIDQNGSARIATSDVLVHVERPVRARRMGRLAIPPQGERIVRYLLDTYPTPVRLSDLANAVQLDRGYTSRMVRGLEDAHLVQRDGRSPIRTTSPAELYEAWSVAGTKVTESSFFTDRRLDAIASDLASDDPPEAALTGVFAASSLVSYAEPERVELYVANSRVVSVLAARVRASPVERAGNLVFLVHRDPGVVRIGAQEVRQLHLVSTSQIYRDVMQRGRGRERDLAAELRRRQLRW